MTSKEYKLASERLARAIVAAYGKAPEDYDDLEEQVMSAFVFGAHRAFSMAEGGVQEWQSKIGMLEILHEVFGFPLEMAGNAMEFLLQCLEDKTYQPVIYSLMECGASGYPLVKDDPKALSRTLREMMAVLGQRLEYDETDL